jgi:hypothetical protein
MQTVSAGKKVDFRRSPRLYHPQRQLVDRLVAARWGQVFHAKRGLAPVPAGFIFVGWRAQFPKLNGNDLTSWHYGRFLCHAGE